MRRAGSGLFVLGATLAIASSGCAVNMLSLPYFLFVGEQMVPPKVKLVEKKKDKKKLLVLSYANSGLQWGFDAIDDELTALLIQEISQAENRLEVIPERTVREWRDVNAGWADKSLQEIGDHFDVDYVLFIECADFQLNEGKNQYLLKGKTKVSVKVHDVNKKQIIYETDYLRSYPRERVVSINDVQSEDQFRKSFLRRIAKELSWYVAPHKAGDEIEDP